MSNCMYPMKQLKVCNFENDRMHRKTAHRWKSLTMIPIDMGATDEQQSKTFSLPGPGVLLRATTSNKETGY